MSRTFADSLSGDVDAMLSTAEFATSYTLSRIGRSATTGVAAIAVNRQRDASDDQGGTVAFEIVDLDIAAAAYRIGGAAVEPRPGDRLTSSAGVAFEVLPVPGGQCFSPSDDGLVLSVHVKRVS